MQQALTRQEELLRLFIAILKRDYLYTISETEPWGTLLATEAKKNETRSWPARLSYNGPTYCGPIAIHLSKRMDDAICYKEPFSSALEAAGYKPGTQYPQGNSWGLPLGHIVAVGWLESVWKINEHTTHRLPDHRSAEHAFGNYKPGRFVWPFSCVYRLKKPILIQRGYPSIWKWTPTPDFWDEIQEQLTELQLTKKKERTLR
jgi:hypothetical protein